MSEKSIEEMKKTILTLTKEKHRLQVFRSRAKRTIERNQIEIEQMTDALRFYSRWDWSDKYLKEKIPTRAMKVLLGMGL